MSQLGLAMNSRVQWLGTILASATPRGQESAWKFCPAEWREGEPAEKSADETSEEGRVVIPGSYPASMGKWRKIFSPISLKLNEVSFFFSSHIETQHFCIVLWVVSRVVWSLSTFGNKDAFVTGHQMLECCFSGKHLRILKPIHYLFLECHLLLIVKGVRLENKQ